MNNNYSEQTRKNTNIDGNLSSSNKSDSRSRQKQDSLYSNPNRRISRNTTMFGSRKQQIMLNVKTINDKAKGYDKFNIVAQRLFFGINSILNKNNPDFTTIQHAYSYAITGKTADSPIIEDNMFLSMANISVLQMHYYTETPGTKFNLRETHILADLCKKYNNALNFNLAAYLMEMRTGIYSREIFSAYNSGHTIYDDRSSMSDDDENKPDGSEDIFNNISLNNVLSNSKNAGEMAETLEFQRFIGVEPSLLLTLGTSLCRSVAVYDEYGRFGAESLVSTTITAVLENLSSLNSSLKTRVEAIIKNNNVKPPDLSLNSEICDYVKNMSKQDMIKINSCWLCLTYYNAIVLFMLDKIRKFYDKPCDQQQINTIAAIIHYYLYAIDGIYNNIRNIAHDRGDDYVDLLKVSKIVENMAESGDFCSYPKEFIEQKAETLYFG